MRSSARYAMFASAVLVAVVSVHRLGVAEDKKESGGLPPLVVDQSKPLLLEDPPQDKPQIKANNKACYVCHANYEEEPFAVVHGVADVGCADCHGKSPAHIDDEDHLTPPDIMFPPDEIAAACKECHETHNAEAITVLQRWQERCAEEKNFASLVCTDCHGKHRLEKRTFTWDKRTRKPLAKKKL